MENYNYNFILRVDFPKIDLKNRSQNPAVVAEWREQPLPNSSWKHLSSPEFETALRRLKLIGKN